MEIASVDGQEKRLFGCNPGSREQATQTRADLESVGIGSVLADSFEPPEVIEHGQACFPETDAVAAFSPVCGLFDDQRLPALTREIVGDRQPGEAATNDQDLRLAGVGHRLFVRPASTERSYMYVVLGRRDSVRTRRRSNAARSLSSRQMATYT
ncbi:hypothetical protein VB779_04665 [Haloarculaceae archaeon H-GB11]|nr:hypothetical protein [Haloarculaceae archaeon H-GB11]